MGVDRYVTTEYLSAKMTPRTEVSEAAPAATADQERALKLLVVLSRAQQSVAALTARDIERHGLSVTEFAVLEALLHKGPMLLGELQRRVLVSSGGVTYLVDRLVDRGLVERLECPSDRRARYASLTGEGRALISGIFPAHRDAVLDAMAALSSEEQLQATALLRKLGVSAAAKLEPG